MKHQILSRSHTHCAAYWWMVAIGVLAGSTALAQERRPGESFRDCAGCPEILVIQSGTFLMGCLSPYGWPCELIDALPVHEVRIRQPFGIGKYEVTVAEWDACVSAGGCNGYRPEDPGFHRGSIQERSTVVNVNWDDAQAYVRWLSDVPGRPTGFRAKRSENTRRGRARRPFSPGETRSAKARLTARPTIVAKIGGIPLRWDRSRRILSAYSTCTALSSNGSRIAGTTATLVRLRMAARG